MKYSDVTKLHELGLITGDQRQRIVETLHLREDQNRLLLILCVIGALLITGGIILLISANWELIHRSVKIIGGLSLMLLAYGLGCYWHEIRREYGRAGEALLLLGVSCGTP